MKFVFIADVFADEISGGGELNNDEFINLLRASGHEITTALSHHVTRTLIDNNSSCKFIISNFINLHESAKEHLYNKEYCIYEHDHKYLRNRNPALYKDFIAPDEDIVNLRFYKEAVAVFCQSEFHANIVRSNLKLDNIISLGGNLWPEATLDKLLEYSKEEKENRCSVMMSPILHKNTSGAVRWCKIQGKEYDLISSSSYEEFIRALTKNRTLVFFPQTPETLSRIAVEARMAGMKVVTNNLVGASYEDWFKLKEEELINVMRNKRKEILRTVVGSFE